MASEKKIYEPLTVIPIEFRWILLIIFTIGIFDYLILTKNARDSQRLCLKEGESCSIIFKDDYKALSKFAPNHFRFVIIKRDEEKLIEEKFYFYLSNPKTIQYDRIRLGIRELGLHYPNLICSFFLVFGIFLIVIPLKKIIIQASYGIQPSCVIQRIEMAKISSFNYSREQKVLICGVHLILASLISLLLFMLFSEHNI
ncbi:hypothetical protein JW835_13670 [bacterium]|nr:hypothetical protein [bacterium]